MDLRSCLNNPFQTNKKSTPITLNILPFSEGDYNSNFNENIDKTVNIYTSQKLYEIFYFFTSIEIRSVYTIKYYGDGFRFHLFYYLGTEKHYDELKSHSYFHYNMHSDSYLFIVQLLKIRYRK